MFGRLRWGSSDAFGSAFLGLSLWELCFSLVPPLWVMLFPSLWLGNASGMGGGGGGTCFAPHSLLSFHLPPPLLYLSSSLFFPSFFLAPLLSHLLLLLSLFSVPIFFPTSPPSCLLFIMSFSFVSLPPLFFFEINHFLFHPPLFLLLK